MNSPRPDSPGPREGWQPLQPASDAAIPDGGNNDELVNAVLLPDDGTVAELIAPEAGQTPAAAICDGAQAGTFSAGVGNPPASAGRNTDQDVSPSGNELPAGQPPMPQFGNAFPHAASGRPLRSKPGGSNTVLNDAELALRAQTANGGAVTSVFLGCWAILFSFLSYLSIVNAVLGMAFALWGLSSGKRRLAMAGFGLSLLGLVLTIFHGMFV